MFGELEVIPWLERILFHFSYVSFFFIPYLDFPKYFVNITLNSDLFPVNFRDFLKFSFNDFNFVHY